MWFSAKRTSLSPFTKDFRAEEQRFVSCIFWQALPLVKPCTPVKRYAIQTCTRLEFAAEVQKRLFPCSSFNPTTWEEVQIGISLLVRLYGLTINCSACDNANVL